MILKVNESATLLSMDTLLTYSVSSGGKVESEGTSTCEDMAAAAGQNGDVCGGGARST